MSTYKKTQEELWYSEGLNAMGCAIAKELSPAMIALTLISEACVDESKRHVSSSDTVENIRRILKDTNCPQTRFQLDECLENIFHELMDKKAAEGATE